MKEPSLYEKAYIQDSRFPIQVSLKQFFYTGNIFNCHWHEALEILYFTKGSAMIECAANKFTVSPGDIVIINANELHSGNNLGTEIEYYCIDMCTALLQSGSADVCDIKYIEPIAQNIIAFNNKIKNDIEVINCISNIIKEFESCEPGYELSVKASAYSLLVILLRKHIYNILTPKEFDLKQKSFSKIKNALIYIENNYTEKLTLEKLADSCGFSVFHFCHEFKRVTGKSPGEYINQYRINKAESLLIGSNMNVTEIAMATGFNDANYFCRLFKKYKEDSPTAFRKKNL